MTAAYPLTIRTILHAGKSRNQPASFRLAEPRRGYGYAQQIGTDVPVFWDVAFRFTESEAIAFQLWFTQIINRGADEFTLPLRTEFGMVTHTCRFLPDSLLPAQEDGPLFTYKASIMARGQVIQAAYVEAADLIVALPDWPTWAALLDLAVTSEMLEA